MYPKMIAVAFGCGLALVGLVASAPQGLSGIQANWEDLQTWTRDADSREQELGLGLHPSGGAVVAFLGRLSTRDRTAAPTGVQIQVAAAYMANPTVMRTRTLTFLADAGTDLQISFDYGSGLITDDISPGGVIQNGLGSMPAAEFLRLTGAETLTANILGFEVTFRPDQLDAMEEFAGRLRLR